MAADSTAYSIRFTKVELASLRARAQAAKKPVSQLIREALAAWAGPSETAIQIEPANSATSLCAYLSKGTTFPIARTTAVTLTYTLSTTDGTTHGQ